MRTTFFPDVDETFLEKTSDSDMFYIWKRREYSQSPTWIFAMARMNIHESSHEYSRGLTRTHMFFAIELGYYQPRLYSQTSYRYDIDSILLPPVGIVARSCQYHLEGGSLHTRGVDFVG